MMKKDCFSCGKGCDPAPLGCFFDIQADPFDPNKYIVTINGQHFHVNAPKGKETPTSLTTNYSTPALIYKGETETYTITGEQLGSLINFGDLRDTDFDYSKRGSCFEAIYHKWEDGCGNGCQSVANRWTEFNPFSEGALKDQIHFVRGANAKGCPEYLDVAKKDEYWYAGWRQDTGEFGYYQAKRVDKLPTDALGNIYVLSEDPETKQPVLGVLPLQCVVDNLTGNLGVDIFGTWSVVQETPGFSSEFNNFTGDFVISWNDWTDTSSSRGHVGGGKITGKVDFDYHFDSLTGTMQYKVTGLHFYEAHYVKDNGNPGGSPIILTLKGVPIGGSEQLVVINQYRYDGNSNWDMPLNSNIPCNYTTNIAPGTTAGPLNFAYVYVDWVGDDEGFLQINFRNKMGGWQACL